MAKKLTEKATQELLAEMEDAANNGNWESWHSEYVKVKALLEFPGGELFNPNITGFLWIWRLNGQIQSDMIRKGDRFSAQGLEGKISVQTCLTTALLVWRQLPEHRRCLTLL